MTRSPPKTFPTGLNVNHDLETVGQEYEHEYTAASEHWERVERRHPNLYVHFIHCAVCNPTDAPIERPRHDSPHPYCGAIGPLDVRSILRHMDRLLRCLVRVRAHSLVRLLFTPCQRV